MSRFLVSGMGFAEVIEARDDEEALDIMIETMMSLPENADVDIAKFCRLASVEPAGAADPLWVAEIEHQYLMGGGR